MARVQVEDRLEPGEGMVLEESTLDPNMHYRFVSPFREAKRKAQGYERVLRSESGIRFAHEPEGMETSDDLIRKGDSFLMACNKSLFNKRRKYVRNIAQGRLASSEENFKEKAKKRGVRPLIGDEGE